MKFVVLFVTALVLLVSQNLFAADDVIVGDSVAGKNKSMTCMACHQADGNSTDPQYPKIAGQHESYMAKQLMEFKSGVRQNAIMLGMAGALSPQDMHDLGAYFAEQTTSEGSASADANIELAKKIYYAGDEKRNLPACTSCHGPNGKGNPDAKFPSLAGQHAQYTLSQLTKFYNGAKDSSQNSEDIRKNDDGRLMRNVAILLTNEEMEALAQFLQGLH